MKNLMRVTTQKSGSGRMKGIIASLLALAVMVAALPHQAQAAAARVGTAATGAVGTTAATSFNVTFGAVPTIGNTMIAVISSRSTTANAVSSITQAGVNWQRVASTTGTQGTTTEIWSGPVGSTSATAITVNLTSSTYAAAVVMQYSGLLIGSAVDKVAVNSPTTASTAATTGTTLTTVQADELWVAGFGLVSSGYTATTPASFTAQGNAVSGNATATTNARAYYFDQIVAATGAASAASTVSASSFWSGAIATFRASLLTCTTCHGGVGSFNDGTARNTPAGQFQGSHNGHVAAGGLACSTCHVAPASTGYSHARGTINMAATINYGGKGAGASWNVTNSPTFGSCSGITCHGTGLVWGTNTTNASCTKCHGVPGTTPAAYVADPELAAPGYSGTGRDVSGATAATDPQVGAHDTHLRGLNNYSDPILCSECHSSVNTASSTFTGHMNGTGTVTFSGTAVANGASSAGYTSPNCTNTYCHYGKTFGGAGVAANTSVSWTNTALLTGATSDCQKCHASPPNTTGDHSGITSVTQCGGCHDHVAATGTSFSDKSKHINGVIDGGCSGCHSWPQTTGPHTVHIENIKTAQGLSALPGGFVNNSVCGTCHNVTALTKHMGSAGSDGTSRNIYLPTPTGVQTSIAFGGNPTYDKGTTTCTNVSCHLGTSTAWGTPTTSACQACHGYPPVTTGGDPDNKHKGTPVHHVGAGATVNTKQTFVNAHGGCQICHGTQMSTSGSHEPHANYNVTTQHNTGNINMNGPVGTGTGYDSTIRGCTAACHASTAPYRMTASGKTLTFGNYGTGGDCISCHTTTQGSRAAVVGEFGLAWGHKKSGRAAVAVADCIVCHLEGEFASQSTSATYHKNGFIDLRDPDGTGEAPIKDFSAANYAFRRYSVSYAAGSRTTSGTTNSIANIVTVKFCIACHDANGATNTTARSNNGGTGTAMMPFGGINLGAAYTTANGAAAAGGVVNVAKQFTSTNSSRHPVGAPNSRAYPYSTRLLAPYNGIGTTRDANTQAANTASPRVKANSIVLYCDDCHTTSTSITRRQITSHGNASSLRGTYMVASPTLCTTCHTGAYADATNGRHNTGSAFAVGTTRASGAMTTCHFCHFSNNTVPGGAGRPRVAQDVHGFNELYGTTAGWTVGNASGMRPVAFMRSWATSGGSWPTTHSPRPYTATTTGPGQFNLAAGQSNCGSGTSFAFNTGGSGISTCNSNGHTNYSPGGSY